VFIDESFCKTGMRREYGWAPRGDRLRAKRPGRSWKTLSLIGAIRIGERPKLMTHRGAVDGRTFLRFTKSRLVPWLHEGDVVFLDNLNIHKMVAVRQAIEAAGATVLYLPTYSPELNPIELLWAHLKRGLRRLAVDDAHELVRSVQSLRAQVPLEHIAGWFRCAFRQAQTN
jgi:transposase